MRICADDRGHAWGQPRPVWMIAECGRCGRTQRFDGEFAEREEAARKAGWTFFRGDRNMDLCPGCSGKPWRSTGGAPQQGELL